MPVFENTTCTQPKRVIVIGDFRWRFIGTGPNEGAIVAGFCHIELHAFAAFDIGVFALYEATSRLLP
jgi:hypothetical protein